MSVLKKLKNLIKGNETDHDTSSEKSVTNTANKVAEKTKVEVQAAEELAKSKINEAREAAKATTKNAENKAEEVVEKVAAEVKDKASEVAKNVAETAKDVAKEVTDDAKELANSKIKKSKSKEESNESKDRSDKMTLLDEKQLLKGSDVDKEFTQLFVDAGIDTVEHCFQCGTCGGGCPSGRRTPYKVRQIVRKCLMGLKDEVIADPALWMCTTCYTCQERCPRNVKIVEIIKMARNVAAQSGFMAPAHKATGSFVIKTGHGVPINDATKELRKRVGLNELPPTTHSNPEALEEVQKIMKATGFDTLIRYNWETGEIE
ncbi:MAG: CoB--CoM heterodisulfide reductase subunit C [Methanobacteriaceae archaeon]